MELSKRRTIAFALGFLIDAFAVDRVTKYLAGLYAGPETPQPLMDGVFAFSFRLHRSLNPHFAFSVPAPNWVISVVVVFVFFAVLQRFIHEMIAGKTSSYGLALVLGGALGNLFDRALYGGVIDFIEVSTPWTSTGSFNLADVSIIVGILLWLYLSRSSSTVEVAA